MARARGHDLVKCLETYVGGNVKVSEWSIQCTVASGRETGPRDLSLYLFGTFAALTSLEGQREPKEAKCRDDCVACFPQSVDLLLLSRHRSVSTGKGERERREVQSDVRSQRDIFGLKRVTSPSPSLSRFISVDSPSFTLTASRFYRILYSCHILFYYSLNRRLRWRYNQIDIIKKERNYLLNTNYIFFLLFQVSKSAKFYILTSSWHRMNISE